MSNYGSSVAEPLVRPKSNKQNRVQRQPRYKVVLWDDDDHSYHYVVNMMRKLFGHSEEQGYQVAVEVDSEGQAICLTTTREHAELKRDQIHSYGRDDLIGHCAGSMSATIEPETTE